MNSRIKIAGVILAGGRARRMSNQDKGLLAFKGRPLVGYALAALAPVVEVVFINANRSIEAYRELGCPVISDQTDSFDGPLAGILTAMIHADAAILLVMPCDSPLIKTEHLQKMLFALAENNADVAVAFDGERLHPVFLAIKTGLQSSLQDYLSDGERKVMTWLTRQDWVQVDFSNEPEVLSNINTLDDLARLESYPLA